MTYNSVIHLNIVYIVFLQYIINLNCVFIDPLDESTAELVAGLDDKLEVIEADLKVLFGNNFQYSNLNCLYDVTE